MTSSTWGLLCPGAVRAGPVLSGLTSRLVEMHQTIDDNPHHKLHPTDETFSDESFPNYPHYNTIRQTFTKKSGLRISTLSFQQFHDLNGLGFLQINSTDPTLTLSKIINNIKWWSLYSPLNEVLSREIIKVSFLIFFTIILTWVVILTLTSSSSGLSQLSSSRKILNLVNPSLECGIVPETINYVGEERREERGQLSQVTVPNEAI